MLKIALKEAKSINIWGLIFQYIKYKNQVSYLYKSKPMRIIHFFTKVHCVSLNQKNIFKSDFLIIIYN